MKENSTIVFIEGKEYFVDDIRIDNDGRVMYNVYCEHNVTENQLKDVEEFVKKLLKVS